MKGGGEKIIPLFQKKNDPTIPNEQKKITTNRFMENQTQKPTQTLGLPNPYSQREPLPNQNPLVDLQIYEPVKPQPKPQNPPLFAPIYTNNPYLPPQWSGWYGGQQGWGPMYGLNNMPIIKSYNINVSGPTVDHSLVNGIMEDAVPAKQYLNTANTLGERINNYYFVRSTFIKHNDGEDISLGGYSDNSLLKYLKFIELNPYNPNQMSNNPYKGLPDNMLIYTACYPIRFDKSNNSTQCAKNTLGMNVRIYRMTMGEYHIKSNKDDYYKYNLWREVHFYEYIREKIIKQKVCPNFPIIYGYYISENSDIDFDKLLMIKRKGAAVEPQYIAKVSRIYDQTRVINNPVNPYAPIQTGGNNDINRRLINVAQQLVNPYSRPIGLNANEVPILTQALNCNNGICRDPYGATIKINNNSFGNKALVAMTEAPTYNLYGWASRTYKADGIVKRMTNSGYHKSDIWKSILFQIMTALYVLQVHNIVFRDFTILDNIYIKDISVQENVTNYWKYKINGIDYYIPNYGFLVMIDSNYKDIDITNFTIKKSLADNYKIYGGIFDGDTTNKDLDRLTFSAFISSMDTNSFSTVFTNGGGTKPPEDILDLMNTIHSDAITYENTRIDHFIYKYMRMFMNNRIGTLLKTSEITNIRRDEVKEFKSGQIVIQEIQYDTYVFAMFLSSTDGKVKILTKEDPTSNDIIEKEVTLDNLYNYSKFEPINQNFNSSKLNLNEETLLETYIINNN